jgi:hypothetical protein
MYIHFNPDSSRQEQKHFYVFYFSNVVISETRCTCISGGPHEILEWIYFERKF